VQLRHALRAAIDHLTAANVPSPRMNAELLIMFTLACDRAYLFAHPERELTEDESRRYDDALARRSQGIPAQYITGHQEFWGLDLIVSSAVLIPRPETEHVVEAALELAKTGKLQSEKNASASSAPLRIVDIGTGSGAIALALATELARSKFPHSDLPDADIHASDISPDSLEIARANAARLDLCSRIQFHLADLLQTLPNRAPFDPSPVDVFAAGSLDLVVSNPPYVGNSEEDTVQLEVRKFEPRHAVFAGPTGVEVIERLIPQSRAALKPGGWLIFEISGTIAARVRELLDGWGEVSINKDLQGIDRVAIARSPRTGRARL
jgi:release factor glutamine methyltransferase